MVSSLHVNLDHIGPKRLINEAFGRHRRTCSADGWIQLEGLLAYPVVSVHLEDCLDFGPVAVNKSNPQLEFFIIFTTKDLLEHASWKHEEIPFGIAFSRRHCWCWKVSRLLGAEAAVQGFPKLVHDWRYFLFRLSVTEILEPSWIHDAHVFSWVVI